MKTNAVFKLHALICILVVSSILLTVQVYGQNMCGNSAGSPQPAQFLCAGEEADGSANNPIVGPNAVIKYYLHGGSISTPFDTNFDGLFSNTGNYPTDTQMFISAVVGIGPDPELNDTCSAVQLTGSPVVFLKPVSIMHQFQCEENLVEISYIISGGYPEVVNSNYSIQGSEVNSVNKDNTNNFSVTPLNGTYTLNAEDSRGCMGSITQNYECVEDGVLDLALIKRLASGQNNVVNPGDMVTFTLEVLNQGTVPVIEVALYDYVPNGLILNDPNWFMNGSRAETILITTPSPFPPNGIFYFDINFIVAPTATTITAVNAVEIAAVKLIDGTILNSDIDSTFDFDDSNDGTPIDNEVDDPADEDDHDIEIITIMGSCDGIAGTMPVDTLFGCDGDSLTAIQTVESVLAAGDLGLYYLHTRSSNSLGTPFAINTTGTFTNPGTNCNALFISYVFGPDDGSGKLDFNSDCTTILPGTPVVWSTPLSIITYEDCNLETEMFNVSYEISGGFASCYNTNFNIIGDVNNTSTLPNQTITDANTFGNGATYNITATDNKGCTITATKGPIVCQNTNPCSNSAGSMPTAQMTACSDAQISLTETGSTLGPNDVGIYYLHTNPSSIGNIISSNTVGSFGNPQMNCTTLYISYVFGPDDNGDGEPDADNPCRIILQGTPVQWLPDVTISSTAACVENSNEFKITYEIGGGSSVCNANSTFNVSGDVVNNNIVAGSYTSNPIAGGQAYQITATDINGCMANFTSNLIDCDIEYCGNEPGTTQMPNKPNACAGSAITVSQNNANLLDGFVGNYYLHPNSGTTLGEIIAFNDNGIFEDPVRPCETLYISYVFGPDDGTGNVILNDNCTFVLNGVAVSWASPLNITTLENCDGATGNYTVKYTISGGFPACDNSILYNVSGAVNFTGLMGGSYTSEPFTDGDSYSITLEDGNNCITNYTSAPISCQISCNNSAGTPKNAQILCEDDTADGTTTGAAAGVGSSIAYVLHNGVNMLDTVFAANASGQFLNDGTYPINRQLYISAVVGPIATNDSIPDLLDTCTEIGLPGTPVVFLTDLTITTEIMCNQTTGIATIDYVPNGGYPAFDASKSYTITGSNNTTALFGDTKSFIDNSSSFSLTATDEIGCTTTISELTNCSTTIMCVNRAGNQPNNDFALCYDTEIDASSTGTLLGDGASLVYVLHNGVDNLGTPEAVNSNGIFVNDGSYPTNEQLYISAMVGVLNLAGIPELTDSCTVGNFPGTPVTFLAQSIANDSYVCSEDGSATVTFSVSGGTGNYTVTGSYTGSVLANDEIVFISPANEAMYSLKITDSNGCAISIEQNKDCEATCNNQAGNIAQEEVFICNKDKSTFSANNTLVNNGYKLYYVLHDGATILGSIIDYNTTGSFTNNGQYDTNKQFYISPVVTADVNGEPNFEDACRNVTLPGQPVLFFEPITIADEPICSPTTTDIYLVRFSIDGGAPAAEGFADNYSVSGAFGGSASLGTIIESPAQTNSDYTIRVEDDEGCVTEIFKSNVDCANCPVFSQSSIQNIFSPNNDNVNNFWSVPNLSECYPNNHVIISNRWGNIVWEMNGCTDDCWDGRAQKSEEELPTGAYYYIIKLNGDDSVEEDIIAGSITLLR